MTPTITCAGNLLLSEEEQQEIHDVVVDVIAGSPIARGEALAMISELKQRFNVSLSGKTFSKLLSVEDVSGALVWFMRIRTSHIKQPCGYDLGEFIRSHPYDGVQRTYTCPNCGNTGTFTNMPEE